MPRIARVVAVGVPHHVTQRGNHRVRTFFSDADRELYLELLTEYCRLHHVELLGYCLMSNHVHLIAVPHRSDSLARGIGRAHNAFSRWMNIGRHQTGHFFQARFDSTPMDSTHYPASLGLHGTELDWGGALWVRGLPQTRRIWEFWMVSVSNLDEILISQGRAIARLLGTL